MSALRNGPYTPNTESGGTLRVATVATVIAGLVLLGLSAFRFSYPGIHRMALATGASPQQAWLLPLIMDGMLVIAAVSAVALHGAWWWLRWYAWLLVLVLLAAMAALDAMQAAGIAPPRRPAAVVMALVPWLLVLFGLGLLAGVMRHLRGERAAAAAGGGQHYGPAAPGPPREHAAHRESPPRGAQAAHGAAPDAGRADAGGAAGGYGPGGTNGAGDRSWLPGFKHAGASAGLDEPDEPVIRLLPPGPKPGTVPERPAPAPERPAPVPERPAPVPERPGTGS